MNLFDLFLNYIKRPILYRFFILHWEIFRQPPFFFRYHGYKLFYLPKDGLVYLVATDGSFEKDILNHCQKLLPHNAVFFDIGANIGLITIPLAKILPEAKFHCFEPSLNPYKCFKQTITKNNLSKRIKLNKLAVYDKQTRLKFYVHDVNESSLDGIKDTNRSGYTSEVVVSTITLDDYVKKNKIERVDAVKIDIEGAELKALHGAVRTIQRFHPIIFFEAWPQNYTSYGIKTTDIYRFFQKIRYGIYDLTGRKLNLKNFKYAVKKDHNYLASYEKLIL